MSASTEPIPFRPSSLPRRASRAAFQAPFPNFSADLGSSATVAQALKKYPQYTGITVVKQNTGHSNYNAFQARLQHQFRDGFSLLGSFTYAKQMTNAEDEIGQFNDGPQDAYVTAG